MNMAFLALPPHRKPIVPVAVTSAGLPGSTLPKSRDMFFESKWQMLFESTLAVTDTAALSVAPHTEAVERRSRAVKPGGATLRPPLSALFRCRINPWGLRGKREGDGVGVAAKREVGQVRNGDRAGDIHCDRGGFPCTGSGGIVGKCVRDEIGEHCAVLHPEDRP